MEMEICGFQPHLISYFPWGEVSSRPFSHDLLGHFMGGHHLFSGFFQGGHAVFKHGQEHLSRGWIRPEFISEHEGEQGSFCGVMWGGVVLEFGSREEIWPTSGVVGTKDMKVGFDFLIGLFSLSICLGVVGSGKSNVVFEESSKSLPRAKVNWGPLSDIRVSWRLNRLKTFWKKSFPTSAASMVFEHGMMITPFIRLWLTTTMMESRPSTRGKSVTKSTESCLKGNMEVDGMGFNGGHIGWVFTLFC